MAFREGNLLNRYRKSVYINDCTNKKKFDSTSGFVKSNCSTGLAAVRAL